MTRRTILIADPLPLVSDALAIAIAQDPRFSVFEERPTTGPQTVEAASRLWPEIALIDYWMPELQGPEITRAIVSSVPGCMVFLLSWIASPDDIQRSLEAGAAAFISKDVTTAQLASAIEQACRGEHRGHADEVRELIAGRGQSAAEARRLFDSLTSRQAEILQLLDLGWSAQQVADHLSISFKTVRNHISEILVKTDTRAIRESLAGGRACGFLTGSPSPEP